MFVKPVEHESVFTGALVASFNDPALFIDAPEQMEALSGSCLQIPCTFRVKPGEGFNNTRPTFGVWMKRRISNAIFNSSKNNNIYPMSLTGDLSKKNCTTLFSSLITTYTDTYYFRVENWPFRATALHDPLQITVNNSAPRPRIEISGDVNDLKEKQSVTITCSAFTPCPHSPPKLTWTLQQDPHNIIEQDTDRTFTTKIQETITLSDTHDGLTISCSAGYPVNEGKDVKTAAAEKNHSQYSLRDTSVVISPTDPVSVGSVVNLTCSCRGNPPVVNFVWFMISDDRLEMIQADTQVYGFIVADSDRGRLYYCGCRNDPDFQLSTGCQLTFEGDQQSGAVGVQVIVKTLGIMMLLTTLIIFEWTQQKQSMSTLCLTYNHHEPEAEEEDVLFPFNASEISTMSGLSVVVAIVSGKFR
ncbi:myelin-associated glycoprotein-like [Centropristis striata]|uniref:myelin-associated glycoprotein-like n=1 Tax=Centropristis striata TaxID=184440 RepID=UPI0027DEDA5C|nr:myelin-associated glycoprotein-like [Centropristis striata]